VAGSPEGSTTVVPGLQSRLAGHMAMMRRCIPQPRSEKRYGTSIGEQCGFTRTPLVVPRWHWVKVCWLDWKNLLWWRISTNRHWWLHDLRVLEFEKV